MAFCDNCGKRYITKECLNCKNNLNTNKKVDNNLLKIAFFILVVAFAFIIGVGSVEFIEIKKQNEIKTKRISQLIDDNKNLRQSRKRLTKQINNFNKNNKKLIKEIRDLKRNTKKKIYAKSNNKKYIKQKVQNKRRNTQYTNKEYIEQKIKDRKKYTQTNNVKQKVENKIYQKFSKNIKLISDSRITIKSNNLLTANSNIYGRFYPKAYSARNRSKNQISNIKCGLKKNIYSVVDECSMNISDKYDKVYLGKMVAKDIQDFNHKTHMIECNYSRTHGVMHDCKIKMYKRR